ISRPEDWERAPDPKKYFVQFFGTSEMPESGKDIKTSFPVDLKNSGSVMSMKDLIAAAQAKKRQAHLQNSYGNPLALLVNDADMLGRSPSPIPAAVAVESGNTLQLDVQGLQPTSPSSDVRQFSSMNEHENEELEEKRVSSGHQATGSSLSGGTEAAVARDAFEGMIETLSRTKESIGRATRLAIDCAKYGIANEKFIGISQTDYGISCSRRLKQKGCY
ncbi:UNVERIFIED_CONTAM: ENHANCER OF AG-4 protein 2, partial [Sesamum indicum]